MNSRYETIRILYEAGMKNVDIAKALNISKQLVGYHLKKFPEYPVLKEERKICQK